MTFHTIRKARKLYARVIIILYALNLGDLLFSFTSSVIFHENYDFVLDTLRISCYTEKGHN